MLDVSVPDAAASEITPPLTWSGKKSLRFRSVVVPDYGRTMVSPMIEAMAWALPWSIHNYPGFRRGMTQVLGRSDRHPKQEYPMVRAWHRKGRRIPLWAMERVRAYVAERLEAGRMALAALDAAIVVARAEEEQRRYTGFCHVHDDGKDRRGNWRK